MPSESTLGRLAPPNAPHAAYALESFGPSCGLVFVQTTFWFSLVVILCLDTSQKEVNASSAFFPPIIVPAVGWFNPLTCTILKR